MSPHDYDSVRRQLDQLLGPDRNRLAGDRAAASSASALRFDDPSICKDFLLGFCLSSLSVKHKALSCGKVHSEEALRQFRVANAQGDVRMKRFWCQDLASTCRTIIDDEDRRIHGVARRLKESYGFADAPSAIIVKDLAVLQELGLLVGGVETAPGALSDDGKEEEADGADGEDAFVIKVITSGGASEPPASESKASPAAGVEVHDSQPKPKRKFVGSEGGIGPGGLLLNGEYKQRVCGQCGGLISLYDAETRLVSHFAGQHHCSMVTLRSKLRCLEDELRGVRLSSRAGSAIPYQRRDGPAIDRGGSVRGLRQGVGVKRARSENESIPT